MKIIFTGRYNLNEILTGPEKVAKRIFSGLQTETNSVFIEYYFDGKKYSIWKKLFGEDRIDTSTELKVLRFGIIRMILYTLKNKPVIIHALTFERFIIVFVLIKMFLRYKLSYTVNSIVTHENSIYKKNIALSLRIKDKITEWLIINSSDKLFFLSEKSLKLARKYYSIGDGKAIIISNGVDEIFHQIFLKRIYKNKEKLSIVLVADAARLEKGLDFFFSAIEPLLDEFEVFIIGEGNTFRSDNIKYVSKMPTNKFALFLKDHDIFISSSFNDTFSLAAVEAMSAGLIPILTYETGVSDYILNDFNGYNYYYGDKEALRKILIKLKSDYEIVKANSNNASIIYDKLNWVNVCKDYLENFRLMLGE